MHVSEPVLEFRLAQHRGLSARKHGCRHAAGSLCSPVLLRDRACGQRWSKPLLLWLIQSEHGFMDACEYALAVCNIWKRASSVWVVVCSVLQLVLQPVLHLSVGMLPKGLECTGLIHFKWLFLLPRSYVHIWKLHPKFPGGSFCHCLKIVIVLEDDPTGFLQELQDTLSYSGRRTQWELLMSIIEVLWWIMVRNECFQY